MMTWDLSQTLAVFDGHKRMVTYSPQEVADNDDATPDPFLRTKKTARTASWTGAPTSYRQTYRKLMATARRNVWSVCKL